MARLTWMEHYVVFDFDSRPDSQPQTLIVINAPVEDPPHGNSNSLSLVIILD